MKSFSYLLAACAGLAGALFTGLPRDGAVAAAATPPPTPPPITAPVLTPEPAASLPTPSAAFPARPAASASPTPTPPPNARKGLNGVWEVQIQHPDSTEYTHLNLTQDGAALNGTYLDSNKKRYPLVGTIDGQDVRLIVSLPNGTTLLMEGRLDGTTDMVGLLTTAGGQIPFTASYRAKEKWIENVNASPGGIPSQGGYTPP